MTLSPAERAAGLTQPLPAGEQLLWQAKPDRASFTATVFRLRLICVWLGFAAVIVFGLALRAGRPAGQAIAEVTLLIPFALAGWSLLSLIGRASAGATTYTLTDRRLILHIGVAYEMTISVPLSAVTNAALRRTHRGCGDIALSVRDSGGAGYVALWPHVRAGHFMNPQPMLRSVPDVDEVCQTIADALVAFNAGGRVFRAPEPAVLPPREAVAA